MNRKKLKKEGLALLCAVSIATSGLPILNVVPVYADGMKVVSIGADLTPEQKKTMEKYFGIEKNKSVQHITVTNKDEVSHLASYIPLEQIGTKTVSCSYIKPTDKGGIKVRTANLQYVTANMIASTLADLGVENCEVVSACPFEVSGTGALTGIIMAYETATGEKIDEAKKDIATQEVVITKDLAKDIGTTEAEFIINQAKAEAVQNNIADKQEIKNTVTNIVNNNNITISNDHIENITNLTQNIVNQNYGDTYIENLNEINNNIQQEIIASDDVDIEIDMDAVIETEEPDETEFAVLDKDSIFANMDSEILGENIIESSTDDPTLIVESKSELETEKTEEASNSEDTLFEITTESTDETVVESPAKPSENVENTDSEATEEVETKEDKFYDKDGNLKFDNIELPEDGIPFYQFYGTDINSIKETFGEEVAKKYMLLEMFLQEKYPYDANNNADVKANEQIVEGEEYQNSELENKESHLASAVGKCVLDGYTEYFANNDTEISVMDIVLKFAGDMELSLDDELSTFVEKLNITKEVLDEEMEEVIVEDEELESLEIPEETIEEVVVPEGTSPKTDAIGETNDNNVIDISNVELPEDGVPYLRYYGINTNDLKERFGERVAKEYLLLEQELVKLYPFEDLRATDVEINGDVVYESEYYYNDETENKNSFLVGFYGKQVIEGYIKYFGEKDTSKSLLENIQECFDNHKILDLDLYIDAVNDLDENLVNFISNMTPREEAVKDSTETIEDVENPNVEENTESTETNEDTENIDISDVVLPEDGIPYYKYYGINTNDLKDKFGERIAKEYLLLEQKLLEICPYDDLNTADIEMNADIIYESEDYINDKVENKSSLLAGFFGRPVIEGYIQYLENKTPSKPLLDYIQEKFEENQIIDFNAAKGLDEELLDFLSKLTAPGEIVEEAVEESVEETEEATETSEYTGNIDISNIVLPEDGVSYYKYYGHDVNWLKDTYGENIAKEYIALENYLKDKYVFDAWNEEDAISNAAILNGDENYLGDPDENKDTYLGSAIAKSVVDAYFEYFESEEKEKSVLEIANEILTFISPDLCVPEEVEEFINSMTFDI